MNQTLPCCGYDNPEAVKWNPHNGAVQCHNCGSTNPNLHSAECFEDYEKATGMARQEPVVCAECERLKGALKRANDQAEHFEREWYLRGDEIEKLQASPPQRQWVGLTDEEMKDIVWNLPYEPSQEDIRAIEAKLKEKNT